MSRGVPRYAAPFASAFEEPAQPADPGDEVPDSPHLRLLKQRKAEALASAEYYERAIKAEEERMLR